MFRAMDLKTEADNHLRCNLNMYLIRMLFFMLQLSFNKNYKYNYNNKYI